DLKDRYVVPSVDAITFVVESIVSKESETPGEAPNAPKLATNSEPFSSLQPKEYRRKQQVFDWLGTVNRGIVLAGPGLGKSACLHYLVLDLLSDRPTHETLAKKWGRH